MPLLLAHDALAGCRDGFDLVYHAQPAPSGWTPLWQRDFSSKDLVQLAHTWVSVAIVSMRDVSVMLLGRKVLDMAAYCMLRRAKFHAVVVHRFTLRRCCTDGESGCADDMA